MDKDFTNKARWVADLMKADGVNPEEVTPELCIAYMAKIGKKIQEAQDIYLTRNGAREALGQTILATI